MSEKSKETEAFTREEAVQVLCALIRSGNVKLIDLSFADTADKHYLTDQNAFVLQTVFESLMTPQSLDRLKKR